jgi:hypothetical protein
VHICGLVGTSHPLFQSLPKCLALFSLLTVKVASPVQVKRAQVRHESKEAWFRIVLRMVSVFTSPDIVGIRWLLLTFEALGRVGAQHLHAWACIVGRTLQLRPSRKSRILGFGED